MHEETADWGRSKFPPMLLSRNQAAVIRVFGPSARLSAQDIEKIGVLRAEAALRALNDLVALGLLRWDPRKPVSSNRHARLAVAGLPAR